MTNITIDPDILIKAMTAAIQAAIVVPKEPEPEPTKTTKSKRGRPKKVVLQPQSTPTTDSNIEIIHVEDDVVQVLNESDKPIRSAKKQPDYMMAAKRVSNTGQSLENKLEPVTQKRGEMKFVDVANVPREKNKPDWVPAERRPPVQKMKFQCSKCMREFEAYGSEYPQAFLKEKDPLTGMISSPLVKCDNCLIG